MFIRRRSGLHFQLWQIAPTILIFVVVLYSPQAIQALQILLLIIYDIQ